MPNKEEYSLNADGELDNCPVCQAQKKADNEGRQITREELEKAMQEAKEHGAIVGGSFPEGM